MKKFTKFTEEDELKYLKRGYKLVGKNKHSAVQLCRWTKSKISGGRNCYKKIYGIKSHRCVQFTPTIDFCNFSCDFCWRTFGKNRFRTENKWDSPKEILDEAIISQRKLLSGFGAYVNKSLFRESMNPIHIAISLDGEPSFYPYLVELIKEIKSRKMSVFVVTNGTRPDKIKELIDKDAEPTNISVSVYATNEEDYKKITKSKIKGTLEKVKESLSLLKDFKESRTTIRTTLVKELNLKDPEKFAEIINKYKPKFVQLKGYSWLGQSKKKLKLNNMPTMKEIEDYAEIVAKETEYITKLKDSVSRIVILVKDEETWGWNSNKVKEQEEMVNKRPDLNFKTRRVLT